MRGISTHRVNVRAAEYSVLATRRIVRQSAGWVEGPSRLCVALVRKQTSTSPPRFLSLLEWSVKLSDEWDVRIGRPVTPIRTDPIVAALYGDRAVQARFTFRLTG